MKDELIKNQIKIDIKGDTTAVFTLIPNSRDAFNENKTLDKNITVEIIKDNKFNKLIISDNGGGIPNEVIKHIFKPNFTTKSSDRGTGIGLYITKQIVEKINGVIEVNNIENGIQFTISFNRKS